MSEGRRTKKPTLADRQPSISGRSSVPLEQSLDSPGHLVSRTLSNEESKPSHQLPRTETLFEKQRKVFLETSTADIPSPEAAAVLTSIKPSSGTGTSLSSAENISGLRDRKDSFDSDQRRKIMESKVTGSPRAAPQPHIIKEETTIEDGPDGPVEVTTVEEEVEEVVPSEKIIKHPGASRKVTTTTTTTITSSHDENQGHGHDHAHGHVHGNVQTATITKEAQIEGESGSKKKHQTTENVTVFETEELDGDGNTKHYSNQGAAVHTDTSTTSQHQTGGSSTATTTRKEGLEYLYGGQGSVDTTKAATAASVVVDVPIIHPTPQRQDTQYSHLFDPLAPPPAAGGWDFPTGTKPSNTTPSTSQKIYDTKILPIPSSHAPQIYGDDKSRSSKEKQTYASEKSGNNGRGGGGFCSCLFKVLCCGPLLCCIIYLAMLLALGLTVYFVWPRTPDVQSLDLTTGPLLINNGGVFGIWKLQANVKSDNYISWTFEKVNVLVYDYVADKQIGNGSMSDADFPRRTSTNYTLPISLNYTTATGTRGDPVVQHFLQCGTGNTTIPLRYKVEFFVKGISWLIKPSVEKLTNYTC